MVGVFCFRLAERRESDGFFEYEDIFVRDVLGNFPYALSERFQEMMRILRNTTIVSIHF